MKDKPADVLISANLADDLKSMLHLAAAYARIAGATSAIDVFREVSVKLDDACRDADERAEAGAPHRVHCAITGIWCERNCTSECALAGSDNPYEIENAGC